MVTAVHGSDLVLAGRPLHDAWDRVARYCGLSWSGGPPEVWAFQYFDVLPDPTPEQVTRIDVLAAAALHPGLTREDLAYFVEEPGAFAAWLEGVPLGRALAGADAPLLERLDELATWAAPSFTLLTKVLHRKRPGLIPLVDREIIDWYRPVTGERRPSAAWPHLTRALQQDLVANEAGLADLTRRAGDELGATLTPLRIVDIAIWMGGQR